MVGFVALFRQHTNSIRKVRKKQAVREALIANGNADVLVGLEQQVFRLDWMLAFANKQLVYPTGPRLYIGIMFCH